MSYVRFAWGGSDVYVYESTEGIECCGCRLSDVKPGAPTWFTCETEEEMIAHLAEHRRKGQYVPIHAITGLWHSIPGATKPQLPEPAGLTAASLQLEAALLRRAAELQELADKEERDDESGESVEEGPT